MLHVVDGVWNKIDYNVNVFVDGILVDTDEKNADMVASRVVKEFYDSSKEEDVKVSYEIQTMQPKACAVVAS